MVRGLATDGLVWGACRLKGLGHFIDFSVC